MLHSNRYLATIFGFKIGGRARGFGMFLFLDHSWLSHSAQQSTPVLIALSSDFTSVSESAQSKILSFFIEYFICDFNSKNIFPRHSKCLPKLPSRIPRSLCKLLNYLNMHIYPREVTVKKNQNVNVNLDKN